MFFSKKLDVILSKNLLLSIQHELERISSRYKESKEFH